MWTKKTKQQQYSWTGMKKNEEKVNKAYEEYFGVALFAANSSVGDLWTGWQGNTSWDGDGTEESPYEISDLSDLAGLRGHSEKP